MRKNVGRISVAGETPALHLHGTQGFLCGNVGCSKSLEFGTGVLCRLGVESFDRVLHNRDAATPFEQSFCRKANTVFGYDAEDEEVSVFR